VNEAEKIFRWHPESPSRLGCPQELSGHFHLQEVDRSKLTAQSGDLVFELRHDSEVITVGEHVSGVLERSHELK
jgi:hypothetical protein